MSDIVRPSEPIPEDLAIEDFQEDQMEEGFFEEEKN